MRIYEGSPRQDFEEVFRSIGAYLDRRAMREVMLTEAPDGFIVQGLVIIGGGAWSDTMGTQVKETLTFLDDDISGSWMRPSPIGASPRRSRPGAGYYETGAAGARHVHGRGEAARRVLLRAGRQLRRAAADDAAGG